MPVDEIGEVGGREEPPDSAVGTGAEVPPELPQESPRRRKAHRQGALAHLGRSPSKATKGGGQAPPNGEACDLPGAESADQDQDELGARAQTRAEPNPERTEIIDAIQGTELREGAIERAGQGIQPYMTPGGCSMVTPIH